MAIELDGHPALEPSLTLPNAVEVVCIANEAHVTAFRDGEFPYVNLPSQWRLAYHIVNERSPLLSFNFRGVRP